MNKRDRKSLTSPETGLIAAAEQLKKNLLFYMQHYADYISAIPCLTSQDYQGKWQQFIAEYATWIDPLTKDLVRHPFDAPCPEDLISVFVRYAKALKELGSTAELVVKTVLPDESLIIAESDPLRTFIPDINSTILVEEGSADITLHEFLYSSQSADCQGEISAVWDNCDGMWESEIGSAWCEVCKGRGLDWLRHPFQPVLRRTRARDYFRMVLDNRLGPELEYRRETPAMVIDRILVERSISFTDFAKGLDGYLSEKTIRRIREGEPVRRSSLKKLADKLGVKVDALRPLEKRRTS